MGKQLKTGTGSTVRLGVGGLGPRRVQRRSRTRDAITALRSSSCWGTPTPLPTQQQRTQAPSCPKPSLPSPPSSNTEGVLSWWNTESQATPPRHLGEVSPEPAFELWHLLLKSEIATLEGVTWQSGLRPPVALKDQQARKASIDAHVLGLARQFYDELGPRTSEGAMPPRGMYARSRGVERAV